MILSMFKSFGRSLWHFFVRPAPTSVALMVGPMPNAANDDQAQLLRRAMRAASQPEVEPAFETETTVAEPKLTVVAAPAEETAAGDADDAAPVAEAANEFEEIEDIEETEAAGATAADEDSPEGGIDTETADVALASPFAEEEPAAEADEMAFADEEDTPAEEPAEGVAAFAEEADDETVAESEDEVAALAGAPTDDEAPDDVADEMPDEMAAAGDDDDDPAADDPDEPVAFEAAEELSSDDALTGEPTAEPEALLAAAEDEAPEDVAPETEFSEPEEIATAADDAGDEFREDDAISLAADTDVADEAVGDQADGEALDAAAETADDDAVSVVEAAPVAAEPEEDDDGAIAAVASEEPEPEAEAAPAKKPRKKRASSPRKKKSSTKSSSRKSKTKAEPVPEDDVWVSDAVVWSLSGEWIDGEWHAPEDLDCPQRLEELRELAAEGRLTIWGRSDDAGVWKPIAPSYWKSGMVEPTSLAEGRENVVAEPRTKRKSARKYCALKVSKSQIEEIWHPGAMH